MIDDRSIFQKKKKIIFLDKTHFHIGSYVNKYNFRIWRSKKLQVVLQNRPKHPFWLIVCCGLWKGSIIGPYFLENEDGATITVNLDTYRTMITDFFILPTLPYCWEQCLVSIGLCNLLHVPCHNRFIVSNVWWQFN